MIAYQVCEVLRRLAANVDSPRGLAVRLLAQHHEWGQLQQLTAVAVADYTDARKFHDDAVVTDFARKSPSVDGDLREPAVETFWACERQNKLTNDRLDRFLKNQGPFSPAEVALLPFIDGWRLKIKEVLGGLPLELTPRFSPGATTSDKGSKITIPNKMSIPPSFYRHTTILETYVRRTAWGRVNDAPHTLSPGNEFFSVPKNSRTDRGCCKEASGNVTLQLAAGGHIRRRLSLFGIDLDNGQDLHRKLARKGSLDGGLATVDLSNASDTVARKLVQLLLPELWYELLMTLRASHTIIDGKRVYLEKFSSMGNGFTFELETLLFWTLAETCIERTSAFGRAFCYGDDIILPSQQDTVDLLYKALAFFGLSPNVQKSFSTGPFRESCGGDFFLGEPVRAYFQKNYLDEPQQWVALANGLNALARPELTRAARAYVLDQLPSAVRKLRGPACLGDAVIHDSKPERWVTRRLGDGWEGVEVLAIVPVPRRLPLSLFRPPVVHASALYGVPSSGVSPRGQLSGYKRAWLIVPFEETPTMFR